MLLRTTVYSCICHLFCDLSVHNFCPFFLFESLFFFFGMPKVLIHYRQQSFVYSISYNFFSHNCFLTFLYCHLLLKFLINCYLTFSILATQSFTQLPKQKTAMPLLIPLLIFDLTPAILVGLIFESFLTTITSAILSWDISPFCLDSWYLCLCLSLLQSILPLSPGDTFLFVTFQF